MIQFNLNKKNGIRYLDSTSFASTSMMLSSLVPFSLMAAKRACRLCSFSTRRSAPFANTDKVMMATKDPERKKMMPHARQSKLIFDHSMTAFWAVKIQLSFALTRILSPMISNTIKAMPIKTRMPAMTYQVNSFVVTFVFIIFSLSILTCKKIFSQQQLMKLSLCGRFLKAAL